VVWQVYVILATAVLFAVTGIAAVVHAARQFARRRRRGKEDEPRCGRCGYIIHAGASRTCPECGSNLAVVGVFTPASAPPAFPWLTLWLVAAGAVVLAIYAGPRLAARTPWGWQYYAWCLLDTTRLNHAPWRTEGTFHIDVRGVGRWWAHHVTRVRLDYHVPGPGTRTFQVEVADDGRTARLWGLDPPGVFPPVVPLDRTLYARFVEAAGFDPKSGEGASLVARLDEHVPRMMSTRWQTPVYDRGAGRVSQGIVYSPYHQAGLLGGAVVWVGVSAAGLLILVWRHRRRRRGAAAGARRLVEELRLAA
jgi:hypothetical protein